jgi:hypothetical protein
MSGSVLTYDPSGVTIVVCGYIIPGLVSVSLQWKSSVFQTRKGIRGVHTRVYTPDRNATLVLETLQTSVANDVFTEIVLQDAAAHAGRLEVMLKDISGTSRFTTTDAYITTFPELSFNCEGLLTRKWEIEILSFVKNSGNIGGNAQNGIDITDILSGALGSAKTIVSDGLDTLAGYFNT